MGCRIGFDGGRLKDDISSTLRLLKLPFNHPVDLGQLIYVKDVPVLQRM
jgi:hypothetical protein